MAFESGRARIVYVEMCRPEKGIEKGRSYRAACLSRLDMRSENGNELTPTRATFLNGLIMRIYLGKLRFPMLVTPEAD